MSRRFANDTQEEKVNHVTGQAYIKLSRGNRSANVLIPMDSTSARLMGKLVYNRGKALETHDGRVYVYDTRKRTRKAKNARAGSHGKINKQGIKES